MVFRVPVVWEAPGITAPAAHIAFGGHPAGVPEVGVDGDEGLVLGNIELPAVGLLAVGVDGPPAVDLALGVQGAAVVGAKG